jgi:MFS family permease
MNARHVVRSIAQFKMNPIIKILIISDFLIFSSQQLIVPIFAIFVTDQIIGGSIEVVGIASAVYLLTKSISEVPVGMYIDKVKGEKDDLYMTVFGTCLAAFSFFLLTTVDSVTGLYANQLLLGVSNAIAYPGWYTLFTSHVDKGREGVEWSIYDVLSGFGMAGAAGIGGFLAHTYGFSILFIIVSVISFCAGLLLLYVKKEVLVT